MVSKPKKLLEQVRAVIRLKHYSIRTEEAYVSWIRRYILFHHKRHPQVMGSQEIEAFLTHLAVELNVAASTQNQALSALLFLYREVLHQDLGSIQPTRAKTPRRLPTVLTKDEVRRVLAHLSDTHLLMVQLLYGAGLRLMECVRLRVLLVRSDKGWLPGAGSDLRGLGAPSLAGKTSMIASSVFSGTPSGKPRRSYPGILRRYSILYSRETQNQARTHPATDFQPLVCKTALCNVGGNFQAEI